MIRDDKLFWAKVQKTDTCWLWVGGVNSWGYGSVHRNSRTIGAHRYVLQLMGVELGNSQVDHRCHVRHCVNPSHLRLVTHKQNRENLKGANSNSATGIRGVSWDQRRRKWRGNIKCLGVRYTKRFDTIEEAVAWTIETRNRLFTHNDVDRAA